MMHEWTIYGTTDTGTKFPHWTDSNRARARQTLARLRADHPHVTWTLVRER